MSGAGVVRRARSAARPLRLGWQRRVASAPWAVDLPRGVVSITFDDVPRSAHRNGAPLLEAAGARGTFYVAARLCDPATAGEPGEFLTADDVVDLHRRGHQIGCHTHSHRRVVPGEEADVVAECRRNRAALSALLGGAPIEDFSFPYGSFTYAAKRALGSEYASLRSIDSGVNAGRVDLRLLYAHALATSRHDEDRIEELLDACERRRGWLVLYTHGVDEDPDPYSTTPEELRWVLDRIAARDLDIRTVADARQACGVTAGCRSSARTRATR